MTLRSDDIRVDPFTVAVLENSLIAVARDMKSTTMRTAYTQLWKEQGDLSCCVMNSRCEMVAQDPTGYPDHLATMPYQLSGMIAAIKADLAPGDVLMSNDPYIGGTHLPDVLIAVPLFWEGSLFGFACNRGHWADIGGMGPGSYSPATSEIFQEGLFIPPMKLFEAGQINGSVLELLMANVRNRSNGHGDLRAQYASCHLAERRLKSLIRKYGFTTLTTAMDLMLDKAEALTREALRGFDAGTYRSRDCLDGDGLLDGPVWIDLELRIEEDSMVADLTNSDGQSTGGMNCSHAAAAAGIFYAVKCLTDADNPPNDGCYRPIKVLTRKGSVVDAEEPSAMVGFGEVAYRVMDCAFAALAEANPAHSIASGSGSTGATVLGGRRDREGRADYFYVIEGSSGAYGARSNRDGMNAIRYGVGNAGHLPIEVDEMEHPLRVERYEIVPDTGGAGEFRGGNGFCRVIRVLGKDVKLCITSERHVTPPPGLFGGEAAATSKFILDPGTTTERVLSSKTPYIRLDPGTVVYLQSAGGGGYGDPARRLRQAVERDVLDGYVTQETARSVYRIARLDGPKVNREVDDDDRQGRVDLVANTQDEEAADADN
jgi:N-methylhydantoinase B